jgi:hypothetical protein
MGAWGHGSFENDDAMDWLQEFEEGAAGAVESAFEAVTSLSDGDYLEAPEASIALAAAELVAAARDGDTSGLPDAVGPVLAKHQASLTEDEMLDSARKAVARVYKESELKELWQDSADFQGWQDGLRNLLSRLR